MLARAVKITLEVAVGLFAILVVTVGIGLWRLSSGPVSVDFLTPYLQDSLSDPAGGFRVEVGKTELVWLGWRRSVDLRARDWRAFDKEGTRIAALPLATMRLSLPALLQGVVAPTHIAVDGVRVRFERAADGSFNFAQSAEVASEDEEAGEDGGAGEGAGDESAPTGDTDLTRVARTVLGELLSAPDAARPLSYLRSLEIRQGRVSFIDRRRGTRWRAPEASISLRREPDGISGDADLLLRVAGQETRIGAALVYDRPSDLLDVAFSFDDLEPRQLTAFAPGLPDLSGVRMRLDGMVSLSLAGDGRPSAFNFEMTGQEGEVDLPELLEAPLDIPLLSFAGHLEEDGRRLVVDSARVALGVEGRSGPAVSATAVIEQRESGQEIALRVAAVDVAADDLHYYWPRGMAQNARAWVSANIRDGLADDASLSARLTIPADNPSEPTILDVSGGFEFRDLTVDYFAPLPPATAVSGKASFDETGLVFDIEAGALQDLALSKGNVNIFGLNTSDHRIAIDFHAGGPLRTALSVLDNPRLKLIEPLGFTPAQAAGEASVGVSFTFPLIGDLAFEDVEVTTNGRLEQVALEDALFGQPFQDGSFDLALDRAGMRVRGPLVLAGAPMTVDWRERFSPGKAPGTELSAEVPRLDGAQRAALGLDFSDYLSGPVGASLVFSRWRSGEGRLSLTANLLESDVGIPFLHWEKPPDRPGSLRAELSLQGERITAIEGIDVAAGTLQAKGSAVLRPEDGALSEMLLDTLAFGETRLREVRVRPRPDGGYLVAVAGGVVDAAPFLEEQEGGAAAETPAYRRQERSPLTLSAPSLSRVLLGPDSYLEDVALEVDRNRDGWQRIRLDASIPLEYWRYGDRAVAEDRALLAKRVVVDYGPTAEGYKLDVRADDMGATLRALDIFETMEGGAMTVTGTLPAPLPDGRLSAQVEGGAFRLVRTPGLARLLTVASLTGIGDLLSGEGIGFERVTGAFELDDDLMTTELLRAYGPSLGITAKGQIDFAADESDLSGTLVPAYSVNRILGNIPMLGPLLTGGEGEGVLAVVYRVRGPVDDPQISVNPLSALAPGFLRGLFSVPGAGGQTDSPQAMPPRSEIDR